MQIKLATHGGATMHDMHYHYFTIEQRNGLAQLMNARIGEPGMETALRRLHTPEFGVCESCGADIPFVQLQDNPLLTRCAHCLPAA